MRRRQRGRRGGTRSARSGDRFTALLRGVAVSLRGWVEQSERRLRLLEERQETYALGPVEAGQDQGDAPEAVPSRGMTGAEKRQWVEEEAARRVRGPQVSEQRDQMRDPAAGASGAAGCGSGADRQEAVAGALAEHEAHQPVVPSPPSSPPGGTAAAAARRADRRHGETGGRRRGGAGWGRR
eukprot:101090-Prymnesium_polylepis.1